MTRIQNNKPKQTELTNQDVIDYLIGGGFTPKEILVKDNQVEVLEVFENLNAVEITTIKTKYPELV